MNYITTTQLRFETTHLVEALRMGQAVDLIHRSDVIGQIVPKKKEAKIMTRESIQELKRLAGKMNLPELAYAQREKRLRQVLKKKYHLYGKRFS